MDLLPWARDLSEQLLAKPLPRRWAHSQGVGGLAEQLAHILGDDADLFAAAAWLHDIGYAPDLIKTGMHQLDGARYLRDTESADPRICALVAYHSCAHIEARKRGILPRLQQEFEPLTGLLADALTYCDMSTTPDGYLTPAADRLAEILDRYGPGTIVFDTMTEATPLIFEATSRVEALMAARRSPAE